MMMMMMRRRPLFSLSPMSRQNHHRRHRRHRRPIDDDAVTRIIDGRRNKAVALDEDDEYVDLDELFDDDRPSNRKTLFDLTPALTEKKGNLQKRKNITIEVPEVVKSKAAVLAEETYGDEEEEMDVEGNAARSGEDDDEFDDEDLVRKVVRSVDGILDNVEKESEQNFLVKGTWETFKKGEKIAMNPSVQKGAKIVQKVGVETVKVATPIVAKGVATGIKEGGKLAFKVALGANSMGNERREKKEAKKIVENKSNGNSPSWKKNEGVFKSGKVPFSFGNVDEKEEEENRNVFGSLFGGDGKNESQTRPKKKRTDIFGRERD